MTNYLGKYAVSFGALSSLDPTGIGASYASLMSSLSRNCSALLITSSLNGDAYLSFDGTTNHIYLPTGASLALNFVEWDTELKHGQALYIKDGPSASTTGIITVTPVYRN